MNPHPDLFKMDRSATKYQFSMKMTCFDNEKQALELSYTPILSIYMTLQLENGCLTM